MMKRIRDDVNTLDVRTFVAYAKTADHKLYYESDYKTQVTQADLQDAFVKSALVLFDGTNYIVEMAANKVKTIGTVTAAVAFIEWSALAPA